MLIRGECRAKFPLHLHFALTRFANNLRQQIQNNDRGSMGKTEMQILGQYSLQLNNPDVHRILIEKILPNQATVLPVSEWDE